MMPINSAPARLHELLKSIAGKDLANMPKDWRESFMQGTAEKFSLACSTLHKLLLGDSIENCNWLWQCEPTANYGSNWIASFALVKVDLLDAEMSESMKVQMTAALFPGMKLTVDLFADHHQPLGGGLQAEAYIKVTVAVSGDPELMIAECYLEAVKNDFSKHRQGMSIEVLPAENCCDGIHNPENIHQAFKQVAEAARIAGEEAHGSNTITETVYVELSIDQSASVMDLHSSLQDFGDFFTNTSKALQYA